MRNYGGSLAGGLPRNTTIWEAARGTAATPLSIGVNDSLGEIQATGYTSTGFIADQTTQLTTGIIRLRARENWNNGLNNTGTQLLVITQPVATPLTGSSLVATFINDPASTSINSNTVTINQGSNTPTGGAVLQMGGPGTTGGSYLAVGDVNIAQMSSSWQSVFSPGFKYTGLASSGTLTTNGTLFEMSSRWKASAGTSTFDPPQNGWGIGAFQFSADNSTTGTSQQLGGQIRVLATENWDATHQGTKITLDANALGTGGGKQVASLSPETSIISSDLLTFNDSSGSSLPSGKIVYGRQYIEAYSTQDQTNPVANAENLMSFNNTGISNGISIVTNGTTLSRITMANAGLYNIQFSTQLSQTSGGNHNAFIWLKKNGTAVANTAGDIKVAGNGDRIMASWNYIVDAAASDYYELAWAATDTSVVLDYVAASAPIPAIPSVILTVVPVGA
jgi:hypothetical protein